MNKIFTMARQVGRTWTAFRLMLRAMEALNPEPPVSEFLPSHHWPMPDHRNSGAAADKRAARRRRNVAKRRGA